MTVDLGNAASRIRTAIEQAGSGLVDREALVEVLFLAAVAREHVLVIGPPGTAKSLAVRSVAQQLGGEYFEYLLGRFTEPNELFGPIDLRKLREGIVEVETEGMLPEADVAFIDEVFLGSTAILNTLLGILNEGRFRRGRTSVATELRLCVGASNSLPADPALAAFADRFLVRFFLESVADPQLETLLEGGWNQLGEERETDDCLALVDELRQLTSKVDLVTVRAEIGDAIRTMRSAGIVLTDRRAVKSQSLVAAAALLDGRMVATSADLWVMPLVAPTEECQAIARDVLADALAAASSGLLTHAAELLTANRVTTRIRLVAEAEQLLWPAPDLAGDELRRLREAVLREIDATFSSEDRGEDLDRVREQLVETVAP